MFVFFLSGSGPSGPSSSSGIASPAHIPIPSHSVPDFSYSSSEDEFYDADEFYQSSTSPKHCIEWVSCHPASLYQKLHKVKLQLVGKCCLEQLDVREVCNKIVCEILLILYLLYLSCFLPPFRSLHLLFFPSVPQGLRLPRPSLMKKLHWNDQTRQSPSTRPCPTARQMQVGEKKHAQIDYEYFFPTVFVPVYAINTMLELSSAEAGDGNS